MCEGKSNVATDRFFCSDFSCSSVQAHARVLTPMVLRQVYQFSFFNHRYRSQQQTRLAAVFSLCCFSATFFHPSLVEGTRRTTIQIQKKLKLLSKMGFLVPYKDRSGSSFSRSSGDRSSKFLVCLIASTTLIERYGSLMESKPLPLFLQEHTSQREAA